MKKLLLLLTVAVSFGCNFNKEHFAKKAGNLEWVAVKEKTTNLCFIGRYSSSDNTMAYNSGICVPCDSLKNVQVTEVTFKFVKDESK